jgi:DNA repair protein RadC
MNAGDGAVSGACPGATPKPLAKALLKKFGSFAESFTRRWRGLREVDGLGEASINQIKLLAARRKRRRQGRDQAQDRAVRPGTT